MEFFNTLVRLSWLLVKNTNGEIVMKKLTSKPALNRLAILIYILLSGIFGKTQSYNLVPNNSFENYNVCPQKLNNPPPPLVFSLLLNRYISQ